VPPQVEQPGNADVVPQVDGPAVSHVDLDLNSSTWGSDYVDPFDASQFEASDSTTLDDNYVGSSVYSLLEQSIGGDDENLSFLAIGLLITNKSLLEMRRAQQYFSVSIQLACGYVN